MTKQIIVMKILGEPQLHFPLSFTLSVPHHVTDNTTASSIYTDSECSSHRSECLLFSQTHTNTSPLSPPKKTILHELNSASRFPMLLKPYCTQGFREPWYRRVHSAQLRPAVQPLQTAIVESLHGHWVSERLYLVFSQQFSPVTGGLNIRPSDTGKGPWQLYPPLSLVAKVTLDLDNDVILFCMSGI